MTLILVVAAGLGVMGLALVWSEIVDFLLDKIDLPGGRGSTSG
jgi:hypothetical protein